MKKKVFAMMMVAVLAVSMTACGQTGATAESAAPADVQEEESAADGAAETESAGEDEVDGAQQAEADRTTFTVGFDAEFPPYGYKDESGEYVGFDLDLAEEVCSRNGWELIKQPIDWDSKDMELSSGTIDCIWNGFTMNGREEQYTFSVPYVDNSQVFVVAADSGIETLADLAGKVVGVQKESSALAALEDEDHTELLASFATLNQYADYNTGFMDLEAGAIDALAMDIGVADYNMGQRSGSFVILEEKLATEQYAIGFLKGNTELKDAVEKTLLEMADDGTFMQIAEEYGLADSVCLGK
ncbi:MAG: amino acid ABC transporter substrate-binding protein [Eubacteriales bacterium]|nr:amino acid ABC transporter substrate-binding protein [Eubacteriales bacterium]